MGMNQTMMPVVIPLSAPGRFVFSHQRPRKNIGNNTIAASENANPTSAAIGCCGFSAKMIVSRPIRMMLRRPTSTCWRWVASSLMMFA